jgi:hypothetical protein
MRKLREERMMEKTEENEQQRIDEQESAKPERTDTYPQRKWGPQLLGAMIGAFIFLIAGGLASQLGWVSNPTNRWWLWGAVIGGLLGSTDSLNNSGKILTKKDNKWLNVTVSLAGMAVLFGLVFALSTLVGWILRKLNF